MNWSTFFAMLGYAVGVAGAITVIVSNARKENEKVKDANLKDLKDRVEILEKELVYSKEALEKERKEAQNQHIANREAIAELRAQVKIYKDLQLKDIAETNAEILKALQSSALIKANEQSDGGMLVHTEEASPLDVKQVKE